MTAIYFLFASRDGEPAHELKADPANLDRQIRDLEALGYTVTVLDEDERIKFGVIANQLRTQQSPPTPEASDDLS